MSADSKLTLGPVLYHWPAEEKRDFYFRIADEGSFDAVYVGEVVCAKRAPFFDPFLPEVIERLRRGGKTPILSTLALIMDDRDADIARAAAEMSDILVEANDLSTTALLTGRPHVVGPYVNVYNEGTLGFLAKRGAERVVLPNELSGQAMTALATAARNVDLEVQVFGRLPLAVSARCYHARSHYLHKDGCQFVCANDRNGMEVDTLDGQPFLAVNGMHTLSHTVCNLVRELDDLERAGVQWFRLWPQATDMVAAGGVFRDVLDGRIDAEAAMGRLAEFIDFAPFSNGFYHGREGAALVVAANS